MLLHADGFDHYGNVAARLLDGVYAQAAGVTFVTSGQRTGTAAIKINAIANDSGLRWVLPGVRDKVGVLYAFNMNTLPVGPSAVALLQFLDASNNPVATITVLPTGSLEYRLGGRTAPVEVTGSPSVRTGSMQHFECEASFGLAGATAIEVRINGVTVLNKSGMSAPSACAQVYIGGCYGFPKTGALGVEMIIDDLGVRDGLGTANNTFMGDLKAYTRFPTSDGVEQDWDISSGVDAFAMLDNVPPLDGSEFLSAVAAGERTSVGIGDFPDSIVSVAGVVLASRIWKTDAGNAKVAVQFAEGGSETTNDPHPISTAPSWYGDVSETNPSTGAPWLIADVNALEVVLDREE